MSSILNYPHLSIFILAWFAADLIVPLLILASRRLGILDKPGGHKGQSEPVPFLGGIGIFAAFAIAISSTLRFEALDSFYPLAGMLAGGIVVVVLGLIDDFRPINAIIKLTILFATTLLLSSFGICLQLFPDVMFNIPNVLITLLWIVGVTSAMNSLDNTDGVVGGTCAISAFFLFVIAWGTSPEDAQPWLSYLALALVGSCLGFLRYNFAPARIYLGDNGAFFLGYILATLSVFARYAENPLKAMIIPCLILAVPLFDIVLATALRIRDGEVRGLSDAVLYCGRDHIAHLLQAMGLSKRKAAFAIHGLGVISGLTALLVLAAPAPVTYLGITATYLFFLFTLGMILGKVRRYLPLIKGAEGAAAGWPRDLPAGMPILAGAGAATVSAGAGAEGRHAHASRGVSQDSTSPAPTAASAASTRAAIELDGPA